jgi:hypothetical protein
VKEIKMIESRHWRFLGKRRNEESENRLKKEYENKEKENRKSSR